MKPYKSLDDSTRFTVNGRGVFPIDMLRHDRCWPLDNYAAVTDYNREPQTVTLFTDSVRTITPGRWRSFGWTVMGIDADPAYDPRTAS